MQKFEQCRADEQINVTMEEAFAVFLFRLKTGAQFGRLVCEVLFVDWDKATQSKAFQCILYPLDQKWRLKVLFDVDLFK